MPDKDFTENVLRMVARAALLHVLHINGGESVETTTAASYLRERDLPLLDMSLSTSDVGEVREAWGVFTRLEEGYRRRMVNSAAVSLSAGGGKTLRESEVESYVFETFSGEGAMAA